MTPTVESEAWHRPDTGRVAQWTATAARVPSAAPAGRGAPPPFLTRFVPPRVVELSTLRRPRLLEFLHNHLAGRATLVTAPAGYGKTTLLAQFAAEVDALTCWCTLDERDFDPRTLMSNLVAAVARRVPGFGQRILGALGPGEGAGERQQMRAAAGLFITELHEAIRDFAVLILDDCHTIAASEESSAVLGLLIEHLPEHCHLVVAGREVPEFPALPRLLVSRRVARLGERALRLIGEETGALARVTAGAEPSPAQVAALEAQSQGWPAAVVLLASQVAAEGEPPAATELRDGNGHAARRLPRAAREALFGYLAAEVMAQQPALLQATLLDASILPYVEVERCAALLGHPSDEVRRILDAAEKRALFVARLEAAPAGAAGDAEDAWRDAIPNTEFSPLGDVLTPAGEHIYYRFHDLFRAFLLETLREQQPVRCRWLQRRAAHLAEAAGERSEAVAHALAGRHYRRAARLIEAAAPEMEAGGRWHTLRAWLRSLPDKVLDATPRLLLLKAHAERVVNSGSDAVAQLICRLEQQVKPDSEEAVAAKVLSARWLIEQGRYREAARVGVEALKKADEFLPGRLRGDAHFAYGTALQMAGDLEQACCEIQKAADLYGTSRVTHAEAHSHAALGFLAVRAGNLARARIEFAAADGVWRRFGNDYSRAPILNNLGLIEHYLGDYAAAKARFRDAAQLAQETRLPGIEACALLSLADVLRDCEDLVQAEQLYQRGLELAGAAGSTYLLRYGTDALGQLYRLCGRLDRAEVMARQAAEQAREAGSAYEAALYTRSLAMVHLVRSEHGEASTLLDSALCTFVASGAHRELARTRLYRAQLAQASRPRKEVFAELEALGKLLTLLGYHGFLLADARRAMAAIERGVARDVGGTRLAALRDDALGQVPKAIESEPVATRPRKASAGGHGRSARQEEKAPATGVSREATEQSTTLPVVEAWGLGESYVHCSGRPVSDVHWRSYKSKELFFYLLSRPGWQRKEQIIADVWGDVSPAQARSGFHTNTHRLRRALGHEALESEWGRYRLNPAVRWWFDAEAFANLAKQAFECPDPAESARLAAQAIALYRGPFLDDLSPEWAQPLRDRLETLYLEMLVRVGRYHAARGEHDEALALAHRALEVNPELEPAHALVARCYKDEGRDTAAIHHLQRHTERHETESRTSTVA